MNKFTFRGVRRNFDHPTRRARRGHPPSRAAIESLENRQLLSGTVFTVNSAGDDPSGPKPGTVTLRDAISAVNNDANDTDPSNPDVIKFSIGGKPTINLSANITAVNNPVTIDGSTQAGVTVNGKGHAMLVDDSAVTVNQVTFTGGTATLGAKATFTVNAGSSVSVAGDLNAGDGDVVYNNGSLAVSGNVVDAGTLGFHNAPFTIGTITYTATFTVGGAFTAEGAGSIVYNNGTATFSVSKNFTLGDFGAVYNGNDAVDAAKFIVGGSFGIAIDGSVNNAGASSLKVTGGLTLGDGGSFNNGGTSADSVFLSVGGSFGIGANAHVYNYGTSIINVTSNFTLGSSAYLNNGDTLSSGYASNGDSSTNEGILIVGGSLSLGANATFNVNAESSVRVAGDLDAGDVAAVTNLGTLSVSGNVVDAGALGFLNAPFTIGTTTFTASFTVGGAFTAEGAGSIVNNNGTSTFSVTKNFTLGDGEVNNGSYDVDAAKFTVGGSFGIGINGIVYNGGASSLKVTGSLTLGDDGSFYNGGTSAHSAFLSVGGSFGIGASGFLYNYGASTINVAGALTLGSSGQLDNGDSNSEDATLTVRGSLSVGANTTFTVNAGSSASVAGDLDAGDGDVVINNGSLSVSGNVADAGELEFFNAPYSMNFPTFTATFTVGKNFTLGAISSVYNGNFPLDAAKFTVGGSFGIGIDGIVYNAGASSLKVTGSLTLGDGCTFDNGGDNGGTSGDSAFLSVGGSFGIGASGALYNYGTSTINVAGALTLGSSGYLENGGNSEDATLTVGGNFGIGIYGSVLNEGASSLKVTGGLTLGDDGGFHNGNNNSGPSADSAFVSVGGSFGIGIDGSVINYGANPLKVTGNFSMGNDGFLSNGDSSSAAATLTVGASFNIGDSTAGVNDSIFVYNMGTSTFTVAGNFTLYGNGGNYLQNGVSTSDHSLLKVGGNFDIGVHSTFYNYCTADFGAIVTVDGTIYNYGTIDPPDFNVTSNGLLIIESGGTATAESMNVQTGGEVDVYGFLYVPSPAAMSGNIITEPGGQIILQTTPVLSATPATTTYNGMAQAYPAADVTVTSPSGLAGTFTFTYNNSSTVPTAAGVYSVGATFTPADMTDFTSATTTTTLTIKQAAPVITWNPASPIAYFTPLGSSQLDAAANVPGSFVYAPAAGTLLTAGTQTLSVKFTPSSTNYSSVTTAAPLRVLGPGVNVIGSSLYCVGGSSSNSNDHIQVQPIGRSATGSTGVNVQTQLNGVNAQTNFSQSLSTIYVWLQNGNENVQFSNSLAINAVVTAGNGNDNVQLGNESAIVTLGNGNDNVTIGNGSNEVVMLGKGNDNVLIGNGSNEVVMLGNGNDNVLIGNGSNDSVTIGTGNDNVTIGNGNNNTVYLPTAGNPHAHVKFGTGTGNTIHNGGEQRRPGVMGDGISWV